MNLVLSVDAYIEQIVYAMRSQELVRFFSFITGFGDIVAIVVIATLTTIVLWAFGRQNSAQALLFMIAGSAATGYLCKILVERPRPPEPFPAIVETGYSFPSIHAIEAVALYGFLIFITWNFVQVQWIRAALITGLFSLIVLISFSRVYLGVHYVSDVVAGLFIGAFFLWIGATYARFNEKPA